MFTLKAFSSLNPACRKLLVSRVSYSRSRYHIQSDCKSEDGITTENLNSPDSHVDFRSSKVGTLEALEVSCTCSLGSFELSGVNDQSKCSFDLQL
jgi:hypothetical protein